MQGDRMTIMEASRMADCSPSTIRRWLKTGALQGSKTDGVWGIEEEELRLHLAQLTKPFKGRKGASKSDGGGDLTHRDALHKQLIEDLQRERGINDDLRVENKKLQEEIKGLLASKSGVMGWIRSIAK